MKRYHIVYQTTNLINGFIYIGRHSTDKLEDGYLGSGKLIQKVIREFGRENFKKEILFIYDNPDEMIAKEVELVTDEFRKREDTYNCALGEGEWCMLGKKLKPRSAEYIEKQRIAQKGKHSKPLTEKHKENIRKGMLNAKPRKRGFKHSEESKKKMSESGKRRKHTSETIEKLIKLNTGEIIRILENLQQSKPEKK